MASRKKSPDLTDVLFALADPTRRRVVELVGRGPRRASELAEALAQSRPGMSRHLRILREAGLLAEEGDETDGRARRLSLRAEALDPVRRFLDAVENDWSAQLESFKALAESRASAPKAKRKAS